MEVSTTASGNFETRKKWNDVDNHIERKKDVQHSNEFLNGEKSKQLRKYNKKVTLINFDSWTRKAFGKYVLNYDKKALEKGHFVYGDVNSFLTTTSSGKARSKSLDILYVEKFSNKADYQQLLETTKKAGISEERMYNAISEALIQYARGFNKRNPNIKMFQAVTNMDEKGAPHLHARVMPFVPAKKEGEKPSWALNKALKTQERCKDNREALSLFRDREDKALIDAVNKSFEHEFGKEFNIAKISLYRKKDHAEDLLTGLDHDEYVKAQKSLDDIRKQREDAKNELIKLDNQKAQRKQEIAELDQQKQDKIEEIGNLDERKQKLDEREEDLNFFADKLNERDKKLSEDEKTVKTLKEQLQGLYNRITQGLQKAKGSIGAFVTWLKEREEEKAKEKRAKQDKQKTLSSDLSLLQNLNDNGYLKLGSDDNTLQQVLSKQGKDENNDGIDDDKEADFHHLP